MMYIEIYLTRKNKLFSDTQNIVCSDKNKDFNRNKVPKWSNCFFFCTPQNLDGPDPNSTRPPYLVIESLKNKPVSIPQVTSLLNSFGFVEVRKFPYQRTRALIAVDNYGNARRIMNSFKSNREFSIGQYNALKHSAVVKTLLVSGLTVSGAIILWFTHSLIKR